MKLRIIIFVAVLFFRNWSTAQPGFEELIQNLMAQENYKHATAGIHIVDLSSGEEVYALNSDKLMIPASTMKLVTSAAALQILGPDYRFQTKIGYTGEIVDATLQGDLVVIGGGDPALGSEYFTTHYYQPNFLQSWAEQVNAAGIKRVEGNLVLDGSLYDSEKIPPKWIWEDIANYYGAGASALTAYDNLFRITFRSPRKANQPTEIVAVYPKVGGLTFKNEVLSSNINRDRAFVFGSPLDGKRVIRGTIPKNRSAFTIKASNPFPEQMLADNLWQQLNNAGIFISGNVVFKKVSAHKFQNIYIQESPQLAEIVRVLNIESVNLFTEHLVKQIAVETNEIGNREDGLQQITDFYRKNNFDTNQIVMEDGSGLSHFNLVTPQFFTHLLSYMANSEQIFPVFENSLPSAGEGTLYQFDPENFSEESLLAKSGSMTRVRCYAGYLTANSGKKLAFSFMFNHFSGSHSELINLLGDIFIALKKEY
ncbi:D-alanyl-D-alanine carboxypeptidase / D-alanyl-D-alanine-endopeptidase (penicillin-binding protein 4) [Tangfeifania diversioriginum]|uniref:D-alanyl-D-alanine carboxypeptidase / D-alanyl-D-alanine-endopeptidase (Penicillin-binding protein 4) n=1 Tax=Tangfeifania diversioriginum TaxID=1168035 RepID=A0A1M6CNI6_9BACT|nr:D-alanyl-D-alanine carboxypeptidase/D-alanyl-D-alanine-endopeptidase [Tangfeifania diversioriginum]SHI62278.1 D-alanyl-D-alanine carboxypeptidase / D-alanyl-D-alanine-endopeptidase (penicillin-binding protein 4) [Tangfeifania diversioriginum]